MKELVHFLGYPQHAKRIAKEFGCAYGEVSSSVGWEPPGLSWLAIRSLTSAIGDEQLLEAECPEFHHSVEDGT